MRRGTDSSLNDGEDGPPAGGESEGHTASSPGSPPSVAAGSMRSSAAASSRWSGSA
ncbi:hypothetical protein ACFQRB_03325 [Halobaculum litoreum]|uniref:Uncharacterized protein n=1 Tax=Halobaculum litoreum TaxID=3031998 RepID=A0ABD5XLB9_9EURY